MKRWLPFLVVSTALLLPGTVVFGQADTKADAKAKGDAEADTATADDKEQKELSVPEQISQLISEKKLAKADKLVDGLEQDSRETERFRSQLAQAFMRNRDYAGGAAQYEKLLQTEMGKKDFSGVKIANFVNLLRSYLPRADRDDDVMPMIEKAIELVSTKVDRSKASMEMDALLRMNVVKSSVLRFADKQDESEAILLADHDLTQKLYTEEESDIAARLYSSAMRNLMAAVTDADARREMLETHQGLTSKLAEDGNSEMALGYVQAALSEISRTYRSEPVEAEAMLSTLKEFVDHHAENEKIASRLKPYDRSITSIEARLESAKKLLAMIGQPAPPMDADVTWVGIDQPIDTNGKVVLLDFWALWCGPCIATFPHLKHLSEEYGDKGFQIVGVTRYYNYTWDEESGRPKSGDRSADPNPEVEDEVLQKFLASHELTHPTVVVSKESTMHKDFGVSGIPHVALLDQQGRIQMVKVGSGKANSDAIEAKIRELLGLTESTESAAGE